MAGGRPAQEQPSPLSTSEAATSTESSLPPNLPPALFCRSCGWIIFWLDAAGRLHCQRCLPPPTAAMCRKKLLAWRSESLNWEWREFDREAARAALCRSGAILGPIDPDSQSAEKKEETVSRKFTDANGKIITSTWLASHDEPVPFDDLPEPVGKFRVATRPAEPPALPPPKAAFWFCTRTAGGVFHQSPAKAREAIPDNAVCWTWEGADRWYYQFANPAKQPEVAA